MAPPFLKVEKVEKVEVSILMPIFNGIEFIDESVGSILAQTYDHWELILAINGHPANSDVYQLAKAYEKNNEDKIRVYDFPNMKGKANTLNAMVRLCTYDYIALLDVDDIWHPDKLRIQSQWLPQYDVVGSKCVWFGDRPGTIPPIPVGNISDFDFTLVNPIINSSVIIKKPLCYWNENGIEDYDLWLRLRKQRIQFFNCKEIFVQHRIHAASAFNSKGHHNKVADLLKIY